MPDGAELSVNDCEFVLTALREGKRLDGRGPTDHRQLTVDFGDEYGVANVKLGRTRVLARISAEVTTPLPDRKFDGIFQINTTLSPMASPAFETGRQMPGEVMLSRLLEKIIRRSAAIDTESLCIVAGRSCFAVRADLHIVDSDGSVLDAACIAAIAALRHFRRPDVEIGSRHGANESGAAARVFTAEEREPVPLSLLHHPYCISVSTYDDEQMTLIDATAAEEQVRDAEVIISANRQGDICQIAKYGGAMVHPLAIIGISEVALRKVAELDDIVTKALQRDQTKRDVGGLMAELTAENDR